MKTSILIFIQLALTTFLFSQETEMPKKNKHTVYAEVFGQGFSGSLNYDLLFNSDKKWKRSFTIGIIATPRAFQFGNGAYLGLPVSYNWLYGKKRNFLELGIGLTTQMGQQLVLMINDPNYHQPDGFSVIYTYLTPKIGYRFQPENSGLFLRATLTPHLALVSTEFDFRNGKLITGNTFFKDFMDTGIPAFPWVGASVGYTFK